jgi:hypothetical protein
MDTSEQSSAVSDAQERDPQTGPAPPAMDTSEQKLGWVRRASDAVIGMADVGKLR